MQEGKLKNERNSLTFSIQVAKKFIEILKISLENIFSVTNLLFYEKDFFSKYFLVHNFSFLKYKRKNLKTNLRN